MPSDKFKLFGKLIVFAGPYLSGLILQRIKAVHHRWTYKATTNPKNVIVIGGSFAGVQLARRLAETLPTGFRVVLIEKNSHFNYLFSFTRLSVVQGHERGAFIPYNSFAAKNAPEGIFMQIQDTVTNISDGQVHLASGNGIDYAYLAIATGATQPLPAKVVSTDRDDACAELRSVQDLIKGSQRIAVVGAGAVGIQLAADIKDFYPEKYITLVHSRGQLLSQFGKRLHDYVLSVLDGLGVRTLLNERPDLPLGINKDATLTLSNGEEEMFDLVIPCTGQRPNSSVLASFLPDSISKTSSRILVDEHLRVPDLNSRHAPIFAFGDVAEHGGPRMARAGLFQAEVVLANLLSLIGSRESWKTYKPRMDFEGALKLTIGKRRMALCCINDDGSDLLVTSNDGNGEVDMKRAWSQLGAKYDPID